MDSARRDRIVQRAIFEKLDELTRQGGTPEAGQTITVCARTASGHKNVTITLTESTLAEWREAKTKTVLPPSYHRYRDDWPLGQPPEED